MKIRINFSASFLGFLLVVMLSSCSSVDKEKCTVDYILYKTNYIYSLVFDRINYGLGGPDLGLDKFASKQLKNNLIDKGEHLYESNSIPDIATGYELSTDMKLETSSIDDSFLGSQEELIEIAKQGMTVKVPLKFERTTFYNNGRYKRDLGSVTVLFIYEDSDWVIDDIVYENSVYKSLQDILIQL